MSKPEILELREEVEKLKQKRMQTTELYNSGDVLVYKNAYKKINLKDDWTNYDMCVVIIRGDYNHYKNVIFLKGYGRTYEIHVGEEQSGYYAIGYAYFETSKDLIVKCENARGWGAITLDKVIGIKF